MALLVDLSAGERHLGDVVTRDLDLVLDIGSTEVGNALEERNATDLLLAQEVSDLNDITAGLLDASHVNGEVSIAESHLVLEALDDASDHVLDVRADGTDGSDGLAVAEPEVDLDLATVLDDLDIEGHVLEGASQLAAGASDGDLSGLLGHSDCR